MSKTSRSNSAIFQRLYTFAESNGRFVCLFFLLILALALWGLQYSRLELDIYDVHDPGFQSSVDLYDMKSFYNDRSQMLVAIEFPKDPTHKDICSILEWARRLDRYKEVKAVTSLWSVRSPKVTEGNVWYPKTLRDPCLEKSDEVYQFSQSPALEYFRHLTSASGTRDLVFDISFSGTDSDTSQVQYVIDYTRKFLRENVPDARPAFLGMAAFRYYFKKIMFQDSVLNLVILMIILIFMRLVFGTWRCGFYLCFTLVCTTVILYGSLAYLGIPIDILTNNLFLMTAVAGTADFIFVSQFQMKGGYEDSFLKLIAPSFFTTLTTIVGFLSLNSSDLNLINNFGNGAAIGALVEWMTMFFFLPCFLKLLKLDKKWVNPDKALRLSWIEKLEALTLPKPAIYIISILMLLSVPSFFFLNDQDSPVKNLPEGHVLRTTYEKFQNKFSWQGQVFLYFPELLEKDELQRITNSISDIKGVVRIENPEDLSSEWTRNLNPLRADLIRRELSMTPLWGRYYSEFGTLRIPLYLTEQDLHSLRKFRKEINDICHTKCRLAGQRIVYLEYGEKISRTMIESFGISILLVIGILYWLLWQKNIIRYVIPVVLSALMGPLITLTLISLFQIPVTLITSIFLAVMVGLAGDNAIQYLMASENSLDEGIKDRSRASILVSLVMIMGSSMFIFQQLLPMKILGILFVFGFSINLLGDLWGLKSLLTKKID